MKTNALIGSGKIRILITDDHALLRGIMSFIVNSDSRFTVVAECGSGEEAIEMTKKLHPDIVIMDINLPGLNGIEATEVISKCSSASVIGVSLHSQPTYARKMIQKGAMGYITKNSPKEEMFHAIMEVHERRKYICKEIKNILAEQFIKGDDAAGGLNSLSGREVEILKFIRQGSTSKEIAKHLLISIKTVDVHRYNILRKLKLKNVAALANFLGKYHEN